MLNAYVWRIQIGLKVKKQFVTNKLFTCISPIGLSWHKWDSLTQIFSFPISATNSLYLALKELMLEFRRTIHSKMGGGGHVWFATVPFNFNPPNYENIYTCIFFYSCTGDCINTMKTIFFIPSLIVNKTFFKLQVYK